MPPVILDSLYHISNLSPQSTLLQFLQHLQARDSFSHQFLSISQYKTPLIQWSSGNALCKRRRRKIMLSVCMSLQIQAGFTLDFSDSFHPCGDEVESQTLSTIQTTRPVRANFRQLFLILYVQYTCIGRFEVSCIFLLYMKFLWSGTAQHLYFVHFRSRTNKNRKNY